MERVVSPLGLPSDDLESFLRVPMAPYGTFDLVRCPRSGLVFTNPRWGAEERSAYYDGLASHFDAGAAVNAADEERSLYEDRYEERLREIAVIDLAIHRVLDVGCQMGYFLEAARRRGWEVWGVEPSRFLAAVCRQKGFEQILDQELSSSKKLPPNHFDLITYWQVFEHVADPLGELSAVRRLLAEDGIVAIDLPNLASKNFERQKEDWPLLRPHEHLFHYTPETLTKLLDRAGFVPVKWVHYEGTGMGHLLRERRLGAVARSLAGSNPFVKTIRRAGKRLITTIKRPQNSEGRCDKMVVYAKAVC